MARESKKAVSRGINWRLIFGALAVTALGVSTAAAAYKVRQFVTTDPQFFLSRERKDAISVQGLRYASRSKVQRVFAADYDHSIYSVPLDERQRRLEAIDWIESASVARVWPDRILVTIRERQPVAFVNLRRGVVLIDARGKQLEQPQQAQFTFPVLRGLGDNATEAQCADAVATFLRVEQDLGYLGKDISEIDVADPESIRIITQVDGRAVTLLMGESNFGRRYQYFLKNYPEINKRSPRAKLFDLRLEDRIAVKE